MKNFLIPIDAKIPVQRVMDMVRFLEPFEPDRVYLLHVRSGNGEKVLSKMTDIRTSIAGEGMDVELTYRRGHVASQIVDVADTTNSIICFLKRWKNPLQRALLGSPVTDVVRMSDQPVLIYRKSSYFKSENILKTLLYATDFKFSDKTCLQYIRHKAFKAERLILLHVGQRAPDPETEKNRETEVQSNLARLAGECEDSFQDIQQRQVVGLNIAGKIIREARRNNADLIVVGKLDVRGAITRIMGSTAEAVHTKAPCSVLIIPTEREGM
jgi:nucleotide-binding universal stress UspA family protein